MRWYEGSAIQDIDKICTTPARESDLEVKTVKTPGAWDVFGDCKIVAGAGVREGCKNVGRRGGFEEGLKRCVSRGRRRDFVICDVDV